MEVLSGFIRDKLIVFDLVRNEHYLSIQTLLYFVTKEDFTQAINLFNLILTNF